jgi:outer membrane receptor protein involved in Fe transport
VTGSARPERRFDVSYAVNTLSPSDIKTLAPLNFADLLGELPGIHTEPTGGEVQNITRNRGIPTDDGLIMFQQDGLPLFEDIEGDFFRGDDLNRLDLMDQRVEVVRGGPAPIYSGQAAAIVNNITRTGGPVAQGEAQVTYGTTGLLRLDAFESGPLGNNTYFAIGGFLRRDDGARPDGGFPNDQGGQIRANIKHDFSNGSVRVSVNYLDDHNVFYLPIPISNPTTGQSLNQYINFFTGTLNTPALDNVNIKYVDGNGVTQNINTGLPNGRHTQYGNVGLQYDGDFNGYEVSFKGGLTKGELQFDSLYSVNNPVDANAFTTSASNFSINGLSALGAAQAAFGSGVSRIGYAIAGTNGKQTYNPYSQSGLVIVGQYRYITSDFYSNQGDFSVTKRFDTGLGTHDVKVGVYGAAWGETDLEVYQNYLMQVDTNPQLLDLVGYSSSGTQLGMVTSNGNTTNSNTLYDDDVNGLMAAVYLNDTWTVTDKLRLDAGFRHESYYESGWELNTANVNLTTPGTLVTSTQAVVPGTYYTKLDPTVNNWTVGANYDLDNHFGGYARLSHLDIPPSLIAITYDTTEEKADEYEVGLKGKLGRSYLYVTGFYTAYDPLTASYVPYNAATGLSGKSITLAGKAQDLGVEADASVYIVKGLTLNGSFTAASPEYQSLTDSSGKSYPNVDGKQIVREPKIFFNIRPQYEFKAHDTSFLVYGRYDYTGRRFVDLDNTTALPAYGEFSAGLTATHANGWALQLVGTNLTNAHGLTEGNPRTDFVYGQGTPTAFYARPIYGRDLRIVLSKSW